jgi:hypothetical protein
MILGYALVLFVMLLVCVADSIKLLHTHHCRINTSQCLCTAKITAYTLIYLYNWEGKCKFIEIYCLFFDHFILIILGIVSKCDSFFQMKLVSFGSDNPPTPPNESVKNRIPMYYKPNST